MTTCPTCGAGLFSAIEKRIGHCKVCVKNSLFCKEGTRAPDMVVLSFEDFLEFWDEHNEEAKR